MRRAPTAISTTLGAIALLALGLAVAAFASSTSSGSSRVATSETGETSTTEKPVSTKYLAGLSAGAEVPKPQGIKANVRGTFSVTLTSEGSSYSVKWALAFRNLTGKVTAAHIHRAKPGKAGPVIVALCGPCRSGQSGSAPVSKVVADAMKSGSTYVNVHTAKNKAGEIRGQVKKA